MNLQLTKWSIKWILLNWTKCLLQLWEVQQVAQRSEVLQGAWAAGSTVRASEALPTRAHVLFQDKQLRHIPSNWSWSQAIPTQRWECDCSKYNTYLICRCFKNMNHSIINFVWKSFDFSCQELFLNWFTKQSLLIENITTLFNPNLLKFVLSRS